MRGSTTEINTEEFSLFCKHATQIDVMEMRSIKDELTAPDWSDFSSELQDSESSAQWLLAIKAYEAASDSAERAIVDDSLDAQTRLMPVKTIALGDSDDDEKSSFEKLLEHAKAMTKEMGSEVQPDPRYIHELLRFGKAKLHCISAYLGGVAATEACKMIMSQYLPMNNTLVFDGIHAKGTVFNL